jgi:quercetin dioxygenase-like cupin family protein
VTYFRQAEGTPNPGAQPRFVAVEREVDEVEAAPGVWMRPVFGDTLNLSLVRMEPKAVAAVHEHSEEQIGIVLEGSCDFELGDERRTLGPGSVYVAPPFIPHGATAGDGGCRILDAFSPPREALRELMERSLPSPGTSS